MLVSTLVVAAVSARAATVPSVNDYPTTLEAGAVANHTVVFTTSAGISEGTTLIITFSSGFDLSVMEEDDVDVEDDGTDLTTAPTCAGAEQVSVSVTGNQVTATMCPGDGGAVAAGSQVTVRFGTNATGSGIGVHNILNPTTTRTSFVSIGGTFGESGSVALAIGGSDTISVTARVESPGSGNPVSGGGGCGDTTSPVITSVIVLNVTAASATVTWVTDEATDARVDYGKTETYELGTVRDTSLSVTHQAILTGLEEGTTYFFQTVSSDLCANTSSKGPFVFETPDFMPPQLWNVRVEEITQTTAHVRWETDEPATGLVSFGQTIADGMVAEDNALIISHDLLLSGLQAKTTYHVLARSRDASGHEGSSEDLSFETLSEQPISIEPVKEEEEDGEEVTEEPLIFLPSFDEKGQEKEGESKQEESGEESTATAIGGGLENEEESPSRGGPSLTETEGTNSGETLTSGNVTPSTPASVCGDGICGDGETPMNCSWDCEEEILLAPPLIEEGETPGEMVSSAIGTVQIVVKAVKPTVALTAQALREVIFPAVETVLQSTQKAVETARANPSVQTTVQVAVPLVVVGTAASAATLVSAFDLLLYLQSLFTSPLLLLRRRRRKGYGVVYDAYTKTPIDLAVVRVYRASDHKLIRSRVTDRGGRYFFLLPPGAYVLTVAKVGYVFPSTFLKQVKDDGAYLDVYHGETIQVTEQSVSITPNIPVESEALEQHQTPARIRWLRGMRHFQNAVAVSGLVLALGILLLYPSVFAAILAAFQIAMYLFILRLAKPRKPKGWGMVKDARTGQPIENAVVRIFEPTYRKLLETALTDRRGRYSFLLGPSKYLSSYEQKGYETKEIRDIDFTQEKEPKEFVKDVNLRPLLFHQTPPGTSEGS